MQKPVRRKLQLRKETVRRLAHGLTLATDPIEPPAPVGTACCASCGASCETA